MKANLKLGFGIGFINEIVLQASCCWFRGSSVVPGRRQLTPLLQQEFLISLQIGWTHERSSVAGDLGLYCWILHPHGPCVRNPLPLRLPTCVLPCWWGRPR